MKRCPKCNQEFEEEWLTFCTSDGTPLTEAARSADYPPPTMAMPQRPVTANQAERPTMQMPSEGVYRGPLAVPPQQQPIAPVWQPPPAPGFPRPVSVQQQQQTMASVSLCFGIGSITIGWLCGGPVLALLAVILGVVAIMQIKKDPAQYGGKPLALGGLITGGIVLLFYVGIMLIWIVMLIIGAANS